MKVIIVQTGVLKCVSVGVVCRLHMTGILRHLCGHERLGKCIVNSVTKTINLIHENTHHNNLAHISVT